MKHLVLFIGTLFCLLTPVAAFADYNPLGDACAGNDSTTCTDNTTLVNDKGQMPVLQKVTYLLAGISGIIAIFIIVIAGIQMVSSGGNAQKVAAARGAIVGALIGIAITALATIILSFVISKTIK